VNRETRNAYGILVGKSSHLEVEEGGRYILLTWILEKQFVKVERGNRTGSESCPVADNSGVFSLSYIQHVMYRHAPLSADSVSAVHHDPKKIVKLKK
jgi:hypothetical protein